MAYTSDLGSGQQLYIENQGTQTLVTQLSASAGQQQSQRSSFETGSWIVPPTLFRIAGGLVLQIQTEKGKFFIQLQSSGMNLLSATPSLIGAEVLPLHQADKAANPSMQSMPKMKPMEPMQPMEMRMGNMHMQMGTSASAGHFCSVCGKKVSESDRFCSSCGNNLTTNK